MITKIKNTIFNVLTQSNTIDGSSSESQLLRHSNAPEAPLGFKPRTSSSYFLTSTKQ